MVGHRSFADRSRVVVWFSSHVAQLFSLGSFALYESIVRYIFSMLACELCEIITDG